MLAILEVDRIDGLTLSRPRAPGALDSYLVNAIDEPALLVCGNVGSRGGPCPILRDNVPFTRATKVATATGRR